MKKVLLLCASVFFFQFALARPLCLANDISFQNKNVVLNSSGKTRNPQIYLLHNISKQSFWLNHPAHIGAANAGWASKITPMRWSAILIAPRNKNFILTCARLQPGATISYDCQKILKVCQLQYTDIKTHAQSSYWLTENQLHPALWSSLAQRGVKWH